MLNADTFSAAQHHLIQRQVRWGEMDALGHVNNTVYFRWAEDGRIAHFESLGLLNTPGQSSVGPILASIDTRFRVPLAYPDEVLIGSRLSDLQADRFVVHHQVFSQHHQRIAAEGQGLIVCFDYLKQRKAQVPTPVREAIEAQLAASTGPD